MAETLLTILASACLLGGGAFGIIGGIGVVRFPDFYSRLHAAGITDTFCALLIITGLLILAGLDLVSIKLALILLFLLFTAPTASHALARAAMDDGVEPELADVDDADQRGRGPGGASSNT
ncbi:MAG: monovalent cation/H(+) antiporter subunit G [Wenzhouxiangellaceae bacterium]|nr:monovalent cation/H(+) antiporter subunit G [Wenzhouxiangellaceae bacterium]